MDDASIKKAWIADVSKLSTEVLNEIKVTVLPIGCESNLNKPLGQLNDETLSWIIQDCDKCSVRLKVKAILLLRHREYEFMNTF